jgi:H+/Cl- antiporter ClcA
MAETDAPAPDPAAVLTSRRFVAVLALAAVVGVIASLAAWGFLEGLHELQDLMFTDIPGDIGFDSTPLWWYLPVLAIAGVLAALAIARLPGRGGHIAAEGLDPEPTSPIELPGVVLAAAASIGFGLVLGPEAPLIALGGGLGFLAVRLLRSDAPEDVRGLIAASGTFAAVSFLFGSPLIAAVILIEATGVGGRRLPLVLVPGLMAAGIGSLVSIGMGSWTGVDTADISLDLLPMPDFPRPDVIDFLWTVPLAVAVALVTFVIFAIARRGVGVALSRPLLVLPAVGLAVAGLAIAFQKTTDEGVEQVLFSGQEQLGPLISNANEWSLSALALLIGFKGLAYTLSLASFRGGPVFPALFLGAAGGLMAAGLPGYELTPAVAVCLGAAVVAVLRLPLSAIVLATVLTSKGGLGAGPLIILGVVVAYLVTLALDRHLGPGEGAGNVAAKPGGAGALSG